ncbi:MAG: hypothetical protein KDD47_27990, partial [Acidobacteria bacterium]|nr:hypothetical protein [Acidobacteriota bacterium]
MNIRIPWLPSAALALLFTLTPAPGSAQGGTSLDAPEAATERGFKAEQAYEFGEIDHVNLFNGNLTLTVPIGQTYPIGPELSFGLTLVYNSNLWDYEYRDPGTGQVSQDCNLTWLAMGYDSFCLTKGGPTAGSNAGLGWTLRLGELAQPQDPSGSGQQPDVNPWNRSGRWLYLTADGGSHSFWSTLHSGDGSAGQGLFTRDGSYLRLREIDATHRAVDFPSGIRHIFKLAGDGKGRWPLERMEDPFGNFLAVAESPGNPDEWTLSDNHGRTHYIRFEADPHSLTGQRVQQVDLSAVGGGRAVYEFAYHPSADYRPACSDTAVGVTQEVYGLELLHSVTHTTDLADTWRYTFNYFPEDSGSDVNGVQCSAKAARIESLELPTGGTYTWDYRRYGTPVVDCDRPVNNHTPGPHGIFPENPLVTNSNLSVNWGVETKLMNDADGTQLGRVDYKAGGLIFATPSAQCTVPRVWAGIANIVYKEIGNARVSREDNFFSIWASGEDSEGRGWTDDEYGLPLVHTDDSLIVEGKEYALSRRTYRCPISNRDDPSTLAGCDPIYRTHYLRYDRSFANCNPFDGFVLSCAELNQRVAGEAVVYERDGNPTTGETRWAAKEFSDFDGFGHYRSATGRANFPGLPGSINPAFPAPEDGN